MKLMKKSMDFFIQTRDVDQNDRIRAASLIDFFQDIAGLHAEELGVGYEVLKEKNYAWVILYQRFEIIKMPPYLEYVTITTWPKPKSRLEFEREYLMTSKDGQPLVQGISNWVVIDLESRGLVRTDKINFNGEYVTETNYSEKCKRKLNLDKTKIMDSFTYEVQLGDLDHNGHMNNARYMNVIYNHMDFYQASKYISTVEIAYIKEARFQDELTIGHYPIDGKEAFIGFVHNEVCFECLIGVKEE